MESAPLASLRKGSYTLFQLVITINQKNVSRLSRSYQTHSHNIHFKIMGLRLTIERSYQTHSNNIRFKMTELFRRFSRRRNMSSSRIHCCYIQSLRKNISLSKMRCFVVQSSALGLKKKVCPFLLLENSRPLSPLRESQTPLSSSGTPDFLSAYLGTDSLT